MSKRTATLMQRSENFIHKVAKEMAHVDKISFEDTLKRINGSNVVYDVMNLDHMPAYQAFRTLRRAKKL